MSEVLEDPAQILFNFKSCKCLRGSGKGNQFTLAVKVEFGTNVLGESAKIETDAENDSIILDFSCHMNVVVTEPFVFDEISQKPVVVTFTEILPKDKKAKEEKTNILGQCCVDLLPLLKGENSFTVVELIHPVTTPTLIEPVNQPAPEVEIEISTSKPLFTEEILESSNLLTFCVESVFSLPDAWNQNGNSYLYSACLPIPTDNEEIDTKLLIPKGVYRVGGEKEISEQRKWSFVPSASGCCLYMPDTAICQSSYEDEDGDLKNAEDEEFRHEAESLKSRITWNSEGRCFMFPEAINSLQHKIAQFRYWPLEIIRTSIGNIKVKGKEEEPVLSYHGIVYVDLAPLLYPGVSKIRGAYLVQPFNETELEEKLERKSCLDEKMMKRIIGSNTSLHQLANPKPPAGGKQTRAETRVKQSVGNMKGDAVANDVERTDLATLESQEYIDAKTYIILGIELQNPLVEKRKPEAIAERVAELIPPRPPFQRKQCGSKKAVEDFEKQIINTANNLLDEFRTMFGPNLNENKEEADERRKVFLYDLNQSGKYFAMKEQLKYYVIKLVREKFMYTSSFESQEELQEFISKLYQFLIDKMHTGLNKYLSTEETTEVPPQVADSVMLLHFAKEAQVMFHYDLADKYYQERIVRYKTDAECWFDYGIFNLLIEDVQKAEECFKEVVSLDQNHMNGILLTGLMCFRHEEYSIAEELIDAVTCIHPNEVVPWTLLGLHYSGVENTIMAERSFNVATKLLISKIKEEKEELLLLEADDSLQTIKENEEIEIVQEEGEISTEESEKEKEEEEKVVEEHPSIFLLTSKFLLDCHALPMAERALAHELVAKTQGPKVLYLELLAQLQMKQKKYPSALQSLDEALVLQHENPGVWALKGHLYYEENEFDAAEQAYERCLSYCGNAPDIHSIYLRLATIYLENDKHFESAKHAFLKLCRLSPSCVTWLGAGIACYRLNSILDAEQALNEANILDNKNPEVWSYLSLVCMKEKRHLEAEQCYKYAVKLGLSNEVLKKELMQTMVETNFDTSVL